jgi:adenylate cyclase
MWEVQLHVLPLAMTLYTLFTIYTINMLFGYLFEARSRSHMDSLFGQYVPPDLVKEMSRDPENYSLASQKRELSVLFTDIRGFTTISEGLDASDLSQLMDEYLTPMTRIVHESQGTIDKYIGDAVMAFWNAPFDQHDHALRAVRNAIDMRASLRKMNADGVFGKHVFKIGMGINTGEMIVGNTGGKVHTDYTVLGDSVNLASRLESLTKMYGVDIILSQATVDELEGRILVRRLDKVAVKGKREPVTIYEAVALMKEAAMEQKEFVRAYEGALDDYFGRRFEMAADKCERLLESYPDDLSIKLLGERARSFIGHPPSHDWDGRWVYTEK